MEECLKKEIELLPEEGQKLLAEFCEFLLKKYKKQKVNNSDELKKLFVKAGSKLPEGFYQPVKVSSFSRIAKMDEIYGE